MRNKKSDNIRNFKSVRRISKKSLDNYLKHTKLPKYSRLTDKEYLSSEELLQMIELGEAT